MRFKYKRWHVKFFDILIDDLTFVIDFEIRYQNLFHVFRYIFWQKYDDMLIFVILC